MFLLFLQYIVYFLLILCFIQNVIFLFYLEKYIVIYYIMDTRYDWRLYCTTESRWVEGTTKESTNPTKCFNNNSHSIEPTSVTLLKTISPTTVILKEEEIVTNGNYKCDCVSFNCPPGITTHEISFPFPINLLSTTSTLDEKHAGNVLDVYFVPDSIIGITILEDGANNDSEILVGPNTLSNIFTGLNVSITDYLGSESLGTIQSINTNTSEITVTGDPPRVFDSNNSTIKFSYPTITKTLAQPLLANSFVLELSDIQNIIIGLQVNVDSNPMGRVISINSSNNSIMVNGNLQTDISSNVIVSLEYPDYTASFLRQVRPLNVLAVNETVVQYAQVGFKTKITDGIKSNELGRISKIDKANKHIYLEFPPVDNFASGAYIQVTRYFIENFEFGGAGQYSFSKGRNKGSYIEVGRRGLFKYNNKSNVNVRFQMQLEYLH